MDERVQQLNALVQQLNEAFGAELALTMKEAPLVIEGPLGRVFAYFRSRYDRWYFCIAENEEAVYDHPKDHFQRGNHPGLEGADWPILLPDPPGLSRPDVELVKSLLSRCLSEYQLS